VIARHPAVVLLLCLALAGCGGNGNDGATAGTTAGTPPPSDTRSITKDPANAKVTLTIGSKNFTEQRVLAEVFAQGLRAAGYTVKTHPDLGDENEALKALKDGVVDAYPEYTGTALLSFFGVRAENVPKEPQTAYDQARQGYEKQGLVAFPPTPFTSSNEVAVTRATADRLGLQKISDLAGKAGKLMLYGSPECRRRLDCLAGLEQIYGLHFKRFVQVAIPKRHEVLTSGRADVSIVFTTDPQIKREGFVLLEDDKGMFPPQNSTLVMRRQKATEAGADLPRTLEKIERELTDEAMQELNARVDLDMKDPGTVAREYLIETQLIR
jgi:osmoprotectant transport system substrate-binding protein